MQETEYAPTLIDSDDVTGFKHVRDDFERDPDYVGAGIATEVAERVAWLMDKRNISRSALAERLGVNRAYISKILNAPPNLTVRSIAAIAIALDAKACIELVPAEEVTEGWGARFARTNTTAVDASEVLPIKANRDQTDRRLTAPDMFGLWSAAGA